MTYTITQFQVRADHEFQVDSKNSLVTEVCKSEGVFGFGQGPLMRPGTCIIIFCIYRTIGESGQNEKRSDQNGHLAASGLLISGNHCFKPQDLTTFVADALGEKDQRLAKSNDIKYHGVSYLRLDSRYCKATWYDSDDHLRVLHSGASIDTFFQYKIRVAEDDLSCPTTIESKFAISEVTVELYELRDCKLLSATRSLDDSVCRGKEKMTLVKKTCWEVIIPAPDLWCPHIYTSASFLNLVQHFTHP